MSKLSGRGGKYCCLPQCNSSTTKGYSLFKVPTGAQKRTGVVTDQWAQDFHQVNKTSFASYFCMFEVLANYISTVYNYNCQTFNFLQNVYFNSFK